MTRIAWLSGWFLLAFVLAPIGALADDDPFGLGDGDPFDPGSAAIRGRDLFPPDDDEVEDNAPPPSTVDPFRSNATAPVDPFLEKFALADDREAALADLIPGSDAAFDYRARHLLNTGAFPALEPLEKQWIEKHPSSDARGRFLLRRALVTYDREPRKSLDFLAEKLRLSFDHQREAPGARADIAVAFDPAAISTEAFLKEALTKDFDLAALTNEALPWLATTHPEFLDKAQRRALLERVKYPTFPGLVALILADLKETRTTFGDLGIHKKLLLSQLTELREARPELMTDGEFVLEWLERLKPAWPTDIDTDPVAREVYLREAWDFLRPGPPVLNGLKARVLHHLLATQRQLDQVDPARFLEFLALPLAAPYTDPEYLARPGFDRRTIVKPDTGKGTDLFPNDDEDRSDQARASGLGRPAFGSHTAEDNTALVRTILLRRFAENDDPAPYATFIRAEWLRAVRAEALLTAGKGDAERLVSDLDPADYEALRSRVDLDLAPENPRAFAPDDPVSLALDLKNVPELSIRVFKLNALNHALAVGEYDDQFIDLAGLAPTAEETRRFDSPPLLRARQRFDFPDLTGQRGLWIIEFTGNGASTRALIRKGTLDVHVRDGAAGQVVTVYNETVRPVPGATVRLGSLEYKADAEGRAVLPYAAKDSKDEVVLSDGETANARWITRNSEFYDLSVGFHVERESLLGGGKAVVALRPQLYANDFPASLKLLEHPTLTIEATTTDGTSSTDTERDLAFADFGETLHTFAVPYRLATLTFRLSGTIRHQSGTAEETTYEASQEIAINGIETTAQIAQQFLVRTPDGFRYELRGRNGEPLAHREVTLTFTHRSFIKPINVTVATDAAGAIALGPLPDITKLVATRVDAEAEEWNLDRLRDTATTPNYLGVIVGETPRIAITDPEAARGASLIEIRGGENALDFSDHLAVRDGFLELKDLPAGKFHLSSWRPDFLDVDIIVSVGVPRDDGIATGDSIVPATPQAPLQTGPFEIGDNALTFQIANADQNTRVHLVATHFVPTDGGLLDRLALQGRYLVSPFHIGQPVALYEEARLLSPAYRYILERRKQRVFPGNMLPRPGLLLNPWALSETRQLSEANGGGGSGASFGGMLTSAGAKSGLGNLPVDPSFPTLDFLATPAVTLYNLRPDADGKVTIDRAVLGDRHYVRLFVTNEHASLQRTLVLDEPEVAFRDRRLNGKQLLDPTRHFTRRNATTLLKAGDALTIGDVANSDFALYDDLGDAFTLFGILAGKDTLVDFDFLPVWPGLDDAEKRARYSEFACHELNFFLSRKDPAFFAAVVRPYLANKRVRTFLDDYLLEADLARYAEPWRFRTLNAAERALLAARLDGGRPAEERRLRDKLASIPTDGTREDFLFNTALNARDLAASGAGDLFGFADLMAPADAGSATMRAMHFNKLNDIIISVDFNETTVEDALDFLHAKSVEGDKWESDPSRKGVNFVLNTGGASPIGPDAIPIPDFPITLSLSEVPLVEALKYVMSLAGLKYKIEANAVVMSPQWDTSNEMFTQSFRVPPSFFESGDDGGDTDPFAVDPFGGSDESTAGLKRKPTAREILEGNGIAFPEGASVVYDPSTSTLIVRNTQSQMELAEGYLESMSVAAPSFPMTPANPEAAATWDFEARARTRPLYATIGKVREFAETHYYQTPLDQILPSLAEPNRFWLDATLATTPQFLSPHLAEATSSRAEALLALSLLDLPFTAEQPQTEAVDGGLTLTATGPAIAFHREFQPAETAESALVVARHFFQPDDRTEIIEGRERARILTGNFVAGVVYGCQLTATNPTDALEIVDLLAQIPEGALPLSGGRDILVAALPLSPFLTHTEEVFFYFPAAGTFRTYPAQLSRDGKVLATTTPFTFEVAATRESYDARNWNEVSQFGTAEETLAFLREGNLYRLDLTRVLWRLRDKPFYTAALALLRERQAYFEDAYAYGFLHDDPDTVRSALLNHPDLLDEAGGTFDGALLRLDPEDARLFEILEYDPFINARAHPDPAKPRVLTPALAAQVEHLMTLLSHKPVAAFTDRDRMAVLYYLLLQDRTDEALALFPKIDPAQLATRLQYDYFAAYLAFTRAKPEDAARIATQYKDYPVEKWQAKFANVLAQAAEIEAGARANAPVAEDETHEQKMSRLAATQPAFEFKVEEREIRLDYRNLEAATVRFYPMDLEFLFSGNPFIEYDTSRFSLIEPRQTVALTLDPAETTATTPLPEAFHRANVLVEIDAGGQKKARTIYANDLTVALAANYGRLQVRDAKTGAPLPKVYIKVYSATDDPDESPVFHKDGYTDLRGKFDYLGVSGPFTLDTPPTRFALLITSETHGSEVRLVPAPKE